MRLISEQVFEFAATNCPPASCCSLSGAAAAHCPQGSSVGGISVQTAPSNTLSVAGSAATGHECSKSTAVPSSSFRFGTTIAASSPGSTAVASLSRCCHPLG